jgi:hypothetical protein
LYFYANLNRKNNKKKSEIFSLVFSPENSDIKMEINVYGIVKKIIGSIGDWNEFSIE